MAAKKTKILIFSFLIVIILLVSLVVINIIIDSSDRKSFEDVLSTMSLDKARLFFINHPNSPYKDMLVKELIKWCEQENTEECYEMILTVIPKDHVSYQELENGYKHNFVKKK